jgi:hypothetical protein
MGALFACTDTRSTKNLCNHFKERRPGPLKHSQGYNREILTCFSSLRLYPDLRLRRLHRPNEYENHCRPSLCIHGFRRRSAAYIAWGGIILTRLRVRSGFTKQGIHLSSIMELVGKCTRGWE